MSLSHNALVIIDNFDAVSVAVAPDEAKPPLIIDPHAMLPLSLAVQRFQTIGRRRGQVPKFRCAVELPQFSPGDAFDGLKAPDGLPVVKSLGVWTTERLDHRVII